ncbi:MAG: hypothetical protein RLZZ333_437, partial [Bacteroidota bacterium]
MCCALCGFYDDRYVKCVRVEDISKCYVCIFCLVKIGILDKSIYLVHSGDSLLNTTGDNNHLYMHYLFSLVVIILS